MIETLMNIPEVLKKIDISEDKELINFFDENWHPEKIKEIMIFDRNLTTLNMVLNATMERMKDQPFFLADELLDNFARIYLELGKCLTYVNDMDDLIKKVIIRKPLD